MYARVPFAYKPSRRGPVLAHRPRERTSMAAEDGRRITENLSEGMAIGEETSRAPAVNSQHL